MVIGHYHSLTTTTNYHYHSSQTAERQSLAGEPARCARVRVHSRQYSTMGRTLLSFSLLLFTWLHTLLHILPPRRAWLKMTAWKGCQPVRVVDYRPVVRRLRGIHGNLTF